MLLCYDYENGVTYEEKNIICATKQELFSIGTIRLPKTIQYVKTTNLDIMDIDVKTSILKQEFGVKSANKNIDGNKYEP